MWAPGAYRKTVVKYHPDTNVLAKRIDEETMLVHLDRDRVLHTNATGSRIWELLAEGQDG